MCGIAGIVARRGVNLRALDRMAALLAHRGPDEGRVWLDPTGMVGFAHRRLAIIDLSPGGRQPMRHASGDTVVCYNGEIYNYVELAQRLRSEGVSFGTYSDTEVLIEAYRHWGERFLGELNGMFAFALYDSRRRRLIAARDRYGEKPFLYVATPDYFAFASEYKALLALSEVDQSIRIEQALRFLVRGSEGLDDERVTIFPAIRQLLPGEILTLDVVTLQAQVGRYWDLRPDTDAGRLGLGPAARRLRELLSDSVRLRLRSDVPVGSCLSGGLDSSTIVSLAREHVGSQAIYHAFSGRFPDAPEDEGPFIDAVARVVGVAAHQVEPRPEALLDEMPAFIWHNELPVSSASQYAQWCVFRLARQNGIIVLLDGQGGDELLAGYEQYFRAYIASPGVGAAERRAIRRRYPRALPTPGESIRAALPPALRAFLARSTGRGSDIAFGISSDVVSPSSLLPTSRGRTDDLRGILVHESFGTVLPTLLRYGDRNSMAHSVEVRLPFCDHRLVEFVSGLPPAFLMGDAQTKRLLREAMRGVLPEAIRTRWNKQGFLPPQDRWIQGTLMAAAEAIFEDRTFAERGYWDVPWWREAIRRAKAGNRRLAAALWKMLIVESWQRHFVDRARVQPKISAVSDASAHARDLRQSLPS